ncbi:hypothetical protein WJX84_006264 [Apatococcus fuscideae]|uniref:Pre-mRNA-splicing factor CWC26 n=1 Tax=Apatococcus fuscideae TaxID=2026836 RepID=A0AAW1SJ76_9CHLO
MFKGLSSLRANEAKASAEPTEQAKALQAYLAKYKGGDGPGGGPPRKKRKKVKSAATANAIRIVDEDTSGFAVSATVHEDDEDEPVVANPIEAAKAREQAEKERLGLATSGWAEARLDAERPASAVEVPTADEDLSPPRKRARASPEMGPSQEGPRAGPGLPGRMTDGTRTGMVSGREVAAEMALKRSQEAARVAAMDATTSGRNAETVYRDKAGKKFASREEFEKSRDAETEKKKAQRVTPEWGSGLAQQKAAQEAAEAMRQQAAQPFARTREDLDDQLRDRTRFGDPMAHLVKKKQLEPPAPVIPEHVRNQMAKSGFVIPQAVPAHSWLKRNLGPPLNRYSIRPGRHWDGVDRSNGFEREMFKQQNEHASRDAQAMMWSQEDM